MKKSLLLAATAVVSAGVAFQGSVNLQASTPGTPQNGHLNISGTAKSGFFQGNGSLLTTLNGSALNTGIITLTGTSPTYIIRGTNDSGAANATGLIGIANSTTGNTYGGWFESKSDSGRALFGYASSLTGATYATYAVNNSNAGRACFGLATSLTGNTYGGFFSTLSEAGYGVLGQATAATGTTYGVYGRATSPAGFGVFSEGNMSATGIISGNGSGLTSVNANTLDNLDSSAFLQGIPNPLALSGSPLGSVISGTNSNATAGTSGIKGVSSALTGTTYGLWGTNASTSGRGVFGEATSTSGVSFGGRFESASTTGRGVYGVATSTSGNAYGVFGESQSVSGRGVLGLANATTGTNYGGYFDSDSTSGYGVFANSAGTYGLFASSTKTSGTAYGIYGQSASPSGIGVYGLATSTFGSVYGGRFENSSPSGGGGVYAKAIATSGYTFAGRFENNSTSGRGIYGGALATSGTTYGVLGQADSPDGWSLFAQGRSGGTGTKSFRIDHPFDPENKYLLHYAAESPMPQNFYVGNVVTDSKGYAWVDLPDYFSEINTNFKYQLTVVDESDSSDFIWVKVVQKIKDNRLRIRSNKPGVEVSWRVDADRNDLFVRNRPTKDIVEKEGPEKGTYQHPEFYGLGPERGMNYDPERAKKVIKPSPVALQSKAKTK